MSRVPTTYSNGTANACPSSASSEYTYGYGYAYEYQYQNAHLIVIKHVVNDNGGSATASQFTMTINGVTATGGNSFPGAESPGTNKTVTPGSYNVTETGPAGYVAFASPGCTGTIALGETLWLWPGSSRRARPGSAA